MGSYQKIHDLANKFATLTEMFVAPKNPIQKHDELASQFQDYLIGKLHIILNELGGDLMVMKERKFAPAMRLLLNKLYQDLIGIYKDIHSATPYLGAQELINYVDKRPNNIILDNLNFLIQEHLNKTNEKSMTGKLMQHPGIKSLEKLRELTQYAKDFMSKNPMPNFSGSTTVRPPKL
jgi:hypothetical protein